MPKMEPYKIVTPPPTPQPIKLLASDFPIGTVTVTANLVYIGEIQQRIFIEDMIEGVKEYVKDELKADIGYVIFDPDYQRYEFKLVKPLITE